jgi:hypothetical protein
MRPEPNGAGDDRRAEESRMEASGTRELLAAFTHGDPDDQIRFRDVFAGLEERAFGMLLFVATLPAFIPVPIGGVISGPLAVLIGAQLLIGLHRPWLPRFIAERGLHRSAMIRFEHRLSPWLSRLERLVKPRWTALLDHRLANFFSGLLLVLLGLLLSLPIPLTNYLFAALLLLFALALLERDGALMSVAWVAGVTAIVVFGVLSGNLASLVMEWINHLR